MNNKPSVTIRSVDSLEENLNEIESLIRIRAYERFLERGKQDGQDHDDWFNATVDILHQPLMTLSETDTQIIVILSLQGLDVSALEIFSTRDELLIQGEVRSGNDSPLLRRTIFKQIPLPRHIDADSVRVEFLNGTLRCTATLEAARFLHAKTA